MRPCKRRRHLQKCCAKKKQLAESAADADSDAADPEWTETAADKAAPKDDDLAVEEVGEKAVRDADRALPGRSQGLYAQALPVHAPRVA